jgi:L-ribulose-5-phosphate 3-epimerase
MKKCGNWPIAVCTWSLKLPGIEETAAAIRSLGIQHVHLALAPALGEKGSEYLRAVQRQGWSVTCTMMAFAEEDYSSRESIKLTGGILPDGTWPKNRDLLSRAIALTARMQVGYLSFHFGFIGRPGGSSWRKLLQRTRTLADEAVKRRVVLLMETGQETAEELQQFLDELDHPAVGVNFDPANMVLYDEGAPVEALGVLAPRIRHVHIKDARHPPSRTEWGKEVPWGTGEVDAAGFLRTLERIGYSGALAIEREAGDNRLADIRSAMEELAAYRG